MTRFTYRANLYGIEYDICYGQDKVVGYFLDVFDDVDCDPIISYSQFESYDPHENFENLFSQEITMKATGFNGRLMALLLMFFKLPVHYWFHIGQMKKNSEPPIRSVDYLSASRDVAIKPHQEESQRVGFAYVKLVDPDF